MPGSLPDKFDARPRKMRELGPISPLKKLEQHRAFGRELARAFELMGLKRKDVAFALNQGHPEPEPQIDEAQVSRWCAGTELAPFERIHFELPGFRGAWAVASAEASTGKDIEIEHTIRWRRLA